MVSNGDAAAWGLCDRVTGDPETGAGWWGALQDDAELLQFADEIHMCSSVDNTPSRLFAYIDVAQTRMAGCHAQAFLRGMRLHLDGVADD